MGVWGVQAVSRVIAIIQARLSSSRFPGKILADLGGKPLVSRIIDRVRAFRGIAEVVLAIPNEEPDLWSMAVHEGWGPFRSNMVEAADVLGRFWDCIKLLEAEGRRPDAIMRITADNPLVDAGIAELVLQRFLSSDVDYVSNVYPRPTFPDGTDIEVFSAESLDRAYHNASSTSLREHVTPWIREHCRTDSVVSDHDYSYLRWTVDHVEDLRFPRWVYSQFAPLVEWKELLGWCLCGCGNKTDLAVRTSMRNGWKRGLPRPYFGRHGRRRRNRFWSRVDRSGDCWLWRGQLVGREHEWAMDEGYGRCNWEGRKSLAHRVSYMLRHGPIAPGLDVLHRCDVKRCVRPEHLFLGKDADNQRDLRDKGKHPLVSKLTGRSVEEIRNRVQNGESQKDVAASFGVCSSYVSMIMSGLRWR